MIKGITELNAELAAQTTFFEKEVGFGQIVYLETELPKRGNPLLPIWQRYLADRTNFVGPGQYDPAYYNEKLNDPRFIETLFFDVGLRTDNPVNYYPADGRLAPEVDAIVKTIPPLRRIQGHMSHRRPGSAGGVIQRFEAARKNFLAVPEGKRAEALAELQEMGKELLDAFRNFYRWAVRDPRNLGAGTLLRRAVLAGGGQRTAARQLPEEAWGVADGAEQRHVRRHVCRKGGR